MQPITHPQPPTPATASRLRRFCSALLLGVLAVLLGMAAGSLIATFVVIVIVAAAMQLGDNVAVFLTFGIAVAALVLTRAPRGPRAYSAAECIIRASGRLAMRWAACGPMLAYLVFLSLPADHFADTLFLFAMPVGALAGAGYGALGGAIVGWWDTATPDPQGSAPGERYGGTPT